MAWRRRVRPEDDELARLIEAKQQDQTYVTPSGSGG